MNTLSVQGEQNDKANIQDSHHSLKRNFVNGPSVQQNQTPGCWSIFASHFLKGIESMLKRFNTRECI